MTGAELAIAIGRVLAECRRTGYLPPRCEPHPVSVDVGRSYGAVSNKEWNR